MQNGSNKAAADHFIGKLCEALSETLAHAYPAMAAMRLTKVGGREEALFELVAIDFARVREGGTNAPLWTSGCSSRQKVTLALGETRTMARAIESLSRPSVHSVIAGQQSPTPRRSTGRSRLETASHAEEMADARRSPVEEEQSNSCTPCFAETHSDGSGSHQTLLEDGDGVDGGWRHS